MPTRLLVLSDWGRNKTLRLVEGDLLPRKSHYLALTHRWHPETTSTSSTVARNYRERLKSFGTDVLPLTFIEACEVTHRLGVNYLWIDALCIIQDSTEDWDRETSLMSLVYSNSYLTIAANVSDDDAAGIFRSRDMDNNTVEFQLKGKRGKTINVRATKRQSTWDRLHEEGPLYVREWALQEREMSPRVVHFTHEQVLWECRCLKTYEGWPTENMMKEHCQNGYYNERLLDSINAIGDRNIHDLWYSTVADYSNRLLTKEEDTLPAIAGLAKFVSDYTLSEYVAGLWSEDLLRSLAWGSYNGSFKCRDRVRHTSYVAPSWSWASVSGSVSYGSVKANFEETTLDPTGKQRSWNKGMVVILEHHDELSSANPYGRVKSGYLRMEAPIFKAVLGYDASSNAFGRNIQMRDSTGSRIVGEMYFDVDSERESRKVVHCIYLFRQNCPGSGHGGEDNDKTCGIGLIIAPVEGMDATYTRIGFARCLILEHFESLGAETFTII